MNFRFAVLFTVSCAAHAALLGWPRHGQPPLHVGGEAGALQVSIVPASRQDDTADTQPRLPQRATQASAPAQAAPAPARAVAAAAIEPPPRPAAAPAAGGRDADAPARRQEPAAPAAEARSAEPDGETLSQRISAALLNRLAERFEYPWIARKRGWEGLVTLSLRVERNGDLTHWAVRGTSGHAVLDRSALNAAKGIGRLPEAAEWLDGAPVDMLLPVQYRLLDS